MPGVYIHIPFCKKQCSYCDFHFSTSFESYRKRMVNAICKEIEFRAISENNKLVETIYYGGGTPSILNGSELEEILKSVEKNFDISADCELTMECNPDDCSEENLYAWRKLGVNRLSIGLQSFNDSQLQWMNRAHGANESRDAVLRAAACGFENITIDLMYGLPGLDLSEWGDTIRSAASLPVQHISAYCLTVENSTPLAAWVKSGKIKPANNDEQSEQFTFLVEELAKQGFEQYEISNFAKNEMYSKHNTAYWFNKPYLSFGPSAHGFDGTTRYWNIANNQLYMKAIENNSLPEERETLSKFDRFNELLMVGLRTKWGVNLDALNAILPLTETWRMQISTYEELNYLEVYNGNVILTNEGKLRADAIASDLFQLSN